MNQWLTDHPVLAALIRVLLFVVPVLLIVPGLIWWERRLLSWMQDRIGPNRVATLTLKSGFKIKSFGLLQPIADGVKLFFKEDITPAAVDRLIYFIAPAIALFPAFALGGTLPWGPWPLLTPISDANIGILYVLAVSSLGVYGVVLAGYGSDNKYSLMGGLRASAQLISYELAMGMSLAGVALMTGSLKMSDMVKSQEQPWLGSVNAIANWNIMTPFGFVSAVVFLICMIAETNRAPFDLPEAENELIAGYHTEYSSMKFAVFFMGEYAAMLVFSFVFATIFLGGYSSPLPIRWEVFGPGIAEKVAIFAPAWFMLKGALGITFYIWLRATLPRLRYDQLMHLGWTSLLPLAVGNFILAGLWILLSTMYGLQPALVATVAAAILLFGFIKGVGRVLTGPADTLPTRSVNMTEGKGDERTIELVEPASAGM